MKLIVETVGDFQVYGSTENWARHNRPSVVFAGGLMEQRTANGTLRVLAQVNDDATDEGLVDALAEAQGDTELAVQSYASEFPLEKPEGEAPVKQKATKETKAKEGAE